jgi:hypothetical protein
MSKEVFIFRTYRTCCRSTEERSTARPRFKKQTWGTLRVSILPRDVLERYSPGDPHVNEFSLRATRQGSRHILYQTTMQTLGFSTTTIVLGLLFGSFAVLGNMLALVMVGQINLKAPENERVHYAGWGLSIGKKHRELHPDSKLSHAFYLCFGLMTVCFPILLWSTGFFDHWTKARSGVNTLLPR